MVRMGTTGSEYAERPTVMTVLVERQFVDFFLSPLTVGGDVFWHDPRYLQAYTEFASQTPLEVICAQKTT